MKLSKLFIFLFVVMQTVVAQKAHDYSGIDKKALQLPDSLAKSTDGIAYYINANFTDNKDKSRAIFIWVATNIRYDIDNMFAINFYEKRADKIAKVLASKKGICEHYAALFTDICIKSGLESYVIEGYTKQNNITNYIPHAWSAVLVNGSWQLFDPTWGSGYVSNGKFVRKINNLYYKVSPAALIKTHIPFDYLWQFQNYPITNQEFYEGKTQPNKTKPFFNFSDTLQVFKKQNYSQQLRSTAYRVEKNGVKNAMVFDRLQHLKLEIEQEKQNNVINLYNAAVSDYNEGINGFNDFINYRNKQFTPKKTDFEIQNLIDIPSHRLNDAKSKLGKISNPDANASKMVSQLTKSIDEALANVKQQQDWLALYLSKGKAARKNMFFERKATLFGLPLN